MKFRKLNIQDAFLIKPQKKYDLRGAFFRTFCEKEFFAKSCSEQGGVRTRDLSHERDERNHQTERLTSTKCARTRGFRSSYANFFFLGRDRGVTGRFFAAPLHFTCSLSCPHSRGISGRGQAL